MLYFYTKLFSVECRFGSDFAVDCAISSKVMSAATEGQCGHMVYGAVFTYGFHPYKTVEYKYIQCSHKDHIASLKSRQLLTKLPCHYKTSGGNWQ